MLRTSVTPLRGCRRSAIARRYARGSRPTSLRYLGGLFPQLPIQVACFDAILRSLRVGIRKNLQFLLRGASPLARRRPRGIKLRCCFCSKQHSVLSLSLSAPRLLRKTLFFRPAALRDALRARFAASVAACAAICRTLCRAELAWHCCATTADRLHRGPSDDTCQVSLRATLLVRRFGSLCTRSQPASHAALRSVARCDGRSRSLRGSLSLSQQLFRVDRHFVADARSLRCSL